MSGNGSKKEEGQQVCVCVCMRAHLWYTDH